MNKYFKHLSLYIAGVKAILKRRVNLHNCTMAVVPQCDERLAMLFEKNLDEFLKCSIPGKKAEKKCCVVFVADEITEKRFRRIRNTSVFCESMNVLSGIIEVYKTFPINYSFIVLSRDKPEGRNIYDLNNAGLISEEQIVRNGILHLE